MLLHILTMAGLFTRIGPMPCMMHSSTSAVSCGMQNLMRMLAASASDPSGMVDLMKDDASGKTSLTDQVRSNMAAV